MGTPCRYVVESFVLTYWSAAELQKLLDISYLLVAYSKRV